MRATAFGAAVALAAAGVPAQANPISFYYSTNGSTYTQFGTTLDGSNTATTSFTLGSGSATVQGTAYAPPVLVSPSLQTSFLGISATAAGTVYVAVIEDGVSTPTYTGFGISFGNGASSTVDVLQAAATVVNGNSNVLAFESLGPSSTKIDLASAAGLPASYSLSEIFVASFGNGGGTVDANISIFGVPEPMSLALMGVGLAAFGCVRSQRRK